MSAGRDTVLVIEDDSSHFELIQRSFERAGGCCDVVGAQNLAAARALMARETPDLVISDLRLPDGRGLDILSEMASIGRPVILMTSFGDEQIAVEAIKSGAMDYIVKSEESFSCLPRTCERVLKEWGNLRERTAIANALKESDRRFHAIFNQTFQHMGMLSADGTLIEANRSALDYIGKDGSEVLGRAFSEAPWWRDEAERGKIRQKVKDVLASGFERWETFEVDAEGREGIFDLSLKVVNDDDGGVAFIIAEGRDISARKEAEEIVRRSLGEKELLLREIHHRVKNNLQVIASLLALNEDRIPNEEWRRIFDDSVNRIRIIAQVHELLYQNDDLGCIDLGTQISYLAQEIGRAYGSLDKEIRLSVNVEPVSVNIDQAIPCGLIANEIITNSYKYAFPGDGRPSGTISVEVSTLSDGRIRFAIGDDGVGMGPQDPKPSEGGMGLRLIRLLVQQINGELEVRGGGGVRYEISFVPKAR